MQIVYNPKDGAPIMSFVFNGIQLDPHFPDNYEFRNSSGIMEKSNGLVQYDDATAQELVDTYQFLKIVTAAQAKEIMSRPADPEFKCDFPGCEFTTNYKVALSGHKKSHVGQEGATASEPINPDIPVASGKKVASRQVTPVQDRVGAEALETRNGIDKDGVEWYGEDVKIESPSEFARVKSPGQGHFKG